MLWTWFSNSLGFWGGVHGFRKRRCWLEEKGRRGGGDGVVKWKGRVVVVVELGFGGKSEFVTAERRALSSANASQNAL